MSHYYGQYTTAAATAAGALCGAYCAYRVYQQLTKVKIPTEWTRVGTLQDLYLYPIKSCAPVLMKEAELTLLGLKDGWLRDRFLMVVDEKYNFVTARAFPELVLVQPSIERGMLTVTYGDMEPLLVNLADVVLTQSSKNAKIWGVTVPVYDCGAEASEWFSKFLGKSEKKYRLAFYASQECRFMREVKGEVNTMFKFAEQDTGALGDEVPYHLINEASVEEMNTRLSKSVKPKQFRPNFVLKGPKAYAEDDWKFVKIGENVFEIVEPCVRCLLTTIDPETGSRDANREPVETLKTYRQLLDPVQRRARGNAPRMGIQMALRSSVGGRVSVGDTIYVA